MEVKPGYKQTEVGVIPEDWEVESLARYWNVMDCKHVTAQFVVNGYPIASIREVQSRFVDLTSANQTTQRFYSLLIEGGRKPRVGDLILSRNATVGEVAQVAEWHPPFAMGQDVCLLRKKSSEFSTEFLQSVFRSPIIGNQLSDLMVGSTFKRANVQQIKNLKVPMPLPAEQEAIAEALSDADALIESLKHLLAKKGNLKQGAMQELLTGKKRLPGFSGKWEVKRLGEMLSICHGKSQRDVETSGGLYPVLATGGEIGRANRFLYDKPSVLIGRKGTIDQPQYMDTPFWTVDTLFYSVVHEPNHAKFIFYRFCLIDWKQYNEASGVPSLNARTIESIEISSPGPDEQSAIAAILSDMDAEIAGLEAKLAKVRQLKQGMMQELLTGRIHLVKPDAKIGRLPVRQTSVQAPIKSHNWQINEAVVISVLAKNFGSEQWPLGRKRYTKLSYLLHRYVEGQAEGYLKKAAGPYNPATKYKGPEEVALKNGYVQRHTRDKFSGFVAAEKIGEAERYFAKWYGDSALAWLEQFRRNSNDELELLATVDMAMVDLYSRNEAVQAASVKQVLQNHPEWEAKLDRAIFSDDNISRAMKTCWQLFASHGSNR